MSDLWPDPVAGAPYTSLSLAHLALGSVAREASDFARGLVPTGAGRGGYDGALLADALRIAEFAEQVLAAAVVVEREDGTTWEEIGAVLGVTRSSAHKRWQPVAQRWNEQMERAAVRGRVDDEGLPEVLADPPGLVARRLDEWVVRHREPGDPIAGEHPVSDALERMNPLRELLHLDGVRRQLWASYEGTPPPALLAPLAEREAELEEALAKAAPSNDAGEHAAAAAKARAYAAQLRGQAAPN
jgi:hypothetical protein